MIFNSDLEKESREFEKLVEKTNGELTKKTEISNEVTDQEIAGLLGKTQKKREWSERAKEVISGPRANASKNIYSRWQSKYVKFVEKEKYDKYSEKGVIEFIVKLIDDKYSPGSLWSIYSCINTMFMRDVSKNLKDYYKPRMVMKKLTKDHVANESNIFTYLEIKGTLHSLDDNNPTDLLMKVGISLLYFGLLRKNELLRLEVKDIKIGKDTVIVSFPTCQSTGQRGSPYLTLIGSHLKSTSGK